MDAMTVSHDDAVQPKSAQEFAKFQSSLPHEDGYAGLVSLLQRLDRRLTAAVDVANTLFAARAAGDLYRGLAISPADVTAALARVPGEPFLPLTEPLNDLVDQTDSLNLRHLR